MEGWPEPVGGEGIETPVLRDRRGARHRVEHPLHTRADVAIGGAPAGSRARLGGTGKVVKVGALRLVEPQGASQGIENALRGAAQIAALREGKLKRIVDEIENDGG